MIIIAKLSNGMNVIGVLSLETETHISLEHPMIIEERFDPKTGYRSMVLNRYNLFSENVTVDIDKNHVMSSYSSDEDVNEYYYYSVEHSLKFRDKTIKQDINRASEYLANLISDNKSGYVYNEPVLDTIVIETSNTIH